MNKEKIEKLLVRVSNLESQISEIVYSLKNELYYDDFKEKIESLLDKKPLSFDDIAVTLWLEKGEKKLKDVWDYRMNLEFIDFESTLRTILIEIQDKSDQIYVEGIKKGMVEEVEYVYKKKKK